MAVLRLDPNNFHMDIVIGINESFSPNTEILDLQKEIVVAKEEVATFLKDTFNTDVVAEIQQKLSKDPALEKKWIDFLKNDYTNKFKELSKKVESINDKICSNYSEKSE